jgi:hypothetical protein
MQRETAGFQPAVSVSEFRDVEEIATAISTLRLEALPESCAPS